MSYSPNNGQIFASAFAGALSAFGASAPNGSIVQGNYVQQANSALAVAEAVDIAWGANTNNSMDFVAVGVATGLVLRDRGVFPITPAFSQVSNWTREAQAIVAMILSGDAIATGAGITFPNMGASGAPGTAAYNPSWYAMTDIYLDPVSGNDSNSGAVGHPVKTMNQVIQRYGSISPEIPYAQNLTIHQLTAQTLGVDSFYFNPLMSGGGSFTWTATPVAIGGTFSPNAVTPKVQSSSGNMLKLGFADSGLPAGIAVGQIITNITLGSQSRVANITGLTVTVDQPLLGLSNILSGLSEDNNWAAGNTYHLSAPLLLNWKNPAPQSGDVVFTGNYGIGTISGVEFADPSGGNASILNFAPNGYYLYLINCTIDGTADIDVAPVQLCNCVCYYIITSANCGIFGGHVNGQVEANNGTFDLGFYVPPSSFFILGGTCWLGDVAIFGTMEASSETGPSAGIAYMFSYLTAPATWGTGSVEVGNGYSLQNLTGESFADVLLVPTITIDSLTTAYSFNDGAVGNPYTKGITVTAAHLDTGGGAGNPGLQNPRTGSRIFSS